MILGAQATKFDILAAVNMELIGSSQREITPRQKQILTILLQHGKIALRNIRSFLENPPADRTIRDDSAQLKTLSLVDSEGMGRGARWFTAENLFIAQ